MPNPESMSNPERLFFIAILPPPDQQDELTQIKQYIATKYSSSHALKSPPHITIASPFRWTLETVNQLEKSLQDFGQNRCSFPITLSGFNAFPPRVIYVDVMKNPELLSLQKDLLNYLELNLQIVDEVAKTHTFNPHLTIAHKDLSKSAFKTAWAELQKRSIFYQFTASALTLLLHENYQWEIYAKFPFLQQS